MYSNDPPYWHSMLCIFSFYTLLATTDAPSVPLKITWCSSRSFEPPFPTHLRWKLITGSQRLAWLLVPGFSPSFQFKMARLGVIRCRTPSSLFECWDAITGHVAKEEEKKTLKILVLWHFAEVCSLFEVFEATKYFDYFTLILRYLIFTLFFRWIRDTCRIYTAYSLKEKDFLAYSITSWEMRMWNTENILLILGCKGLNRYTIVVSSHFVSVKHVCRNWLNDQCSDCGPFHP